jgi:hypothetical protein
LVGGDIQGGRNIHANFTSSARQIWSYGSKTKDDYQDGRITAQHGLTFHDAATPADGYQKLIMIPPAEFYPSTGHTSVRAFQINKMRTAGRPWLEAPTANTSFVQRIVPSGYKIAGGAVFGTAGTASFFESKLQGGIGAASAYTKTLHNSPIYALNVTASGDTEADYMNLATPFDSPSSASYGTQGGYGQNGFGVGNYVTIEYSHDDAHLILGAVLVCLKLTQGDYDGKT